MRGHRIECDVGHDLHADDIDEQFALAVQIRRTDDGPVDGLDATAQASGVRARRLPAR